MNMKALIIFVAWSVFLSGCMESDKTVRNSYGISLKSLNHRIDTTEQVLGDLVDSVRVVLLLNEGETSSEVRIEDEAAWVDFDLDENERVIIQYLVYCGELICGSGQDTVYAGDQANANPPFIASFTRENDLESLVDTAVYSVRWGTAVPDTFKVYNYVNGEQQEALVSTSGELTLTYPDTGEVLEQVVLFEAAMKNGNKSYFRDTLRMENQAPELSFICDTSSTGNISSYRIEAEIWDVDGNGDSVASWEYQTISSTLTNRGAFVTIPQSGEGMLDTFTVQAEDRYGAEVTEKLVWRELCEQASEKVVEILDRSGK
jgi:hypothetical protein